MFLSSLVFITFSYLFQIGLSKLQDVIFQKRTRHKDDYILVFFVYLLILTEYSLFYQTWQNPIFSINIREEFYNKMLSVKSVFFY